MPDGLSDIILADRLTDANQRRIPNTGNLQVSWELSKAGMLACDVPYRDLTAAGFPSPELLIGKWVHYTHPTAGAWGGQVTAAGGDDGQITINAESWASCLRGAATDGTTAGTSHVNSNLVRVIDANAATTGVKRSGTSINVGPAGADLWEIGQDIYESLLPAVIEYMESFETQPTLRVPGYVIDPVTRVITMNNLIGTDRSATVALRDGLHNHRGSWSDDLTEVVNRVLLQAKSQWSTRIPGECLKYVKKGGKKKCAKKKPDRIVTGTSETTKIGINQASINQHGPRTMLVVEDYTYANETIQQTQATAMATRLSRNEQLATLETVDEAGVWANFREGDVVSVNLGNSGVAGKMLVRMRALDVGKGTMLVSGEAELS